MMDSHSRDLVLISVKNCVSYFWLWEFYRPKKNYCLHCQNGYVCILHCMLAGSVVYCNRSCVFVALWVCYHDNSKLCASIFTKLGL